MGASLRAAPSSVPLVTMGAPLGAAPSSAPNPTRSSPAPREVSLASPASAPPPERRAGDFLAPVLFRMIGAVRAAAARVGEHGGGDSDPRAVHDLRVALRRLRTMLRPARELYGDRSLRSLGAELGSFARAAGALRDEEALRDTLTALDLPAEAGAELGAWLAQRASQERPKLTAPSLGPTLAALERHLGRRPRRRPAVAIAEAALAEAAAGVASLRSGDPADPLAMHALRLRYKRLRYTAQLFAPVVGEAAAAVAREAARMQKRLGELHDLDEAQAGTAHAPELSDATRAAVSLALVGLRAAAVERFQRASQDPLRGPPG